MKYNTFKVEISNHVAQVAFNRPEKANSLNLESWEEMRAIFEALDEDTSVRAIVLSGEGKLFCAGIDLKLLMAQNSSEITCEALKRESLRKFIYKLQDSITAIEKCRKPVIAAIHNGCIGGAVDIIAACDMRFCTEDAYFTIREVDLGLVADIGTLQRLPNILNPGMMAEMAYTGRNVYGPESLKIGLTTRCLADKEALMAEATKMAQLIAKKSPLVIRGTKEMLLYKRDHTVDESLKNMANYNASMLMSNDLMQAMQAFMTKTEAVYEDS